MKLHFLSRGLLALFFIFLAISVFLQHPAISAMDDGWKPVQTSPPPPEIIIDVPQTFYFSLWHFSDGHWANDDNTITVYGTENIDMNEELANALSREVQFAFPVPQEVKAVLADGKRVFSSCKVDPSWGLESLGIGLHDLFYFDRGDLQFKQEGDNILFKAFPQLHFLDMFDYRTFISNLDKKIPFVDPNYGHNVYSMYRRGGPHLGAGSGYFNPMDPMELPDPDLGQIHPSQIVDSSGHLAPGFMVSVTPDSGGGGSQYDSADVMIGTGSFNNAGAVGLRFWYPLIFSFYTVPDERDVAVTAIYSDRYPASEDVTAAAVAQNNSDEDLDTSLNFTIPEIAFDKTVTVHIEAHESVVAEFTFVSPPGGTITMTAEANKERAFTESDYDNNIMTAIATIIPLDLSATCNSTRIRWAEYDSHLIAIGPVVVVCHHTFIYQTVLSTSHSIDPTTFKSGYGFSADITCSISTSMVDNIGTFCHSWGRNRVNEKKPAPPSQAEVRVPWTVTNKLGTQGMIVALGKVSSNSTRSVFAPMPNSISEISAKKIYTPVQLAGTGASPKKHDFTMYVSGGGVNGVEFCKSITESITINGDMYEDDFTGARGRE
jgi:hypothetical protein